MQQTKYKRKSDNKVFALELVYSSELEKYTPAFISEDSLESLLLADVIPTDLFEKISGDEQLVAMNIDDNELVEVEFDYDNVFDFFDKEYHSSSNDVYKEGYRLKADYDRSSDELKEGINRAFRALCGYGFDTLIKRVQGIDPDYNK